MEKKASIWSLRLHIRTQSVRVLFWCRLPAAAEGQGSYPPVDRLVKTERSAKLAALLRWSVTLICIGLVVAYHIYRNRDDIALVSAPDWSTLSLSWILGLTGCLVLPLILQGMLREHGFGLSYRDSFVLHALPQIGKYLPGKVWSVAGAWILAGRFQVPRDVMVACWTFSTAAICIAGALVGFPVFRADVSLVVPIAALFIVSLWFVYPGLNLFLRLLGRTQLPSKVRTERLLIATAWATLSWLIQGLGFAVLVSSYAPLDLELGAYCVALYGISIVAGFLALFAPGGLGVREAVLFTALSPALGPGLSTMLALVARIWHFSLEACLAVVGWLMLKKCNPVSDRSAPSPIEEDDNA